MFYLSNSLDGLLFQSENGTIKSPHLLELDKEPDNYDENMMTSSECIIRNLKTVMMAE